MRVLLLIVLAMGVADECAFAQAPGRDTASSLAGSVVDASGAAVDGAAIRLHAIARGFDEERETKDGGRVSLTGLRPGRYIVSVSKTGFADVAREVTLDPGQTATVAITLSVQTLRDAVEVVGKLPSAMTHEFNGHARLPEIQGTALYAGKKTDVLVLERLGANLAVGNTRQVFAKVPGTNIWEIDSSGLQVGIANRGLDPNRSWE